MKLSLICTLMALGCGDGTVARTIFDVGLIDAAGEAPFEENDFDSLSISLVQEGFETRHFEIPIDENFNNFLIEFPTLDAEASLFLVATGPTSPTLIGASPVFLPRLTRGQVRIVMGEPGSCEVLEFLRLQASRRDFGMLASESFAFVAGGAAAADVQLELLDLLVWNVPDAELSSGVLGAARIAKIDSVHYVVLSELEPPFRFDLFDAEIRTTDLNVHTGAGIDSGLLQVSESGAWIVGGMSGMTTVNTTTHIEQTTEAAGPLLMRARKHPAARRFGSTGVLIGGGGDAAAEPFELHFTDGTSPFAIGGVGSDGVREAAFLFSDFSSGQALLVGGVDAVDAVRDDTLWITDCETTCAVMPGTPTWENANASAVIDASGQWLVGTGAANDLVEKIVFSESSPSFESVWTLNISREQAAAVGFADGFLLVAGGFDGVETRDDLELCFPEL